ncbi:glycosyltransferase family 9 protein [Motilimonas pumila]|uniref:Lipopolysaccharide heptosyltransferase family protein n=1 Tax=Motilimonas pumila TaxID=2303987 RepID=A0A418YHL0_9GAMM|nr:glycosyltransferase family 9 protein [Motilimonas pumila]RJG49552.1 lipopolysaccharide heptosyltransferase family protein [Motilimonas pumila]
MALFTHAPHSLCILRLSAIGDVCHAIASVQAIQQHWPDTRITWICGKIEAQLIGDLPGIEVVIFDKKTGFKGMRALWKTLKQQRFDALLQMQLALRASALSFGIKAKYRVGFSKSRSKEGQWLFTNRHLPESDSVHVLDNFADFVKYLGVPFDKPHWHIPLSESDQAFAKQAIKQRPCLVISPAASKDERNWLIERYAAAADYFVSKGGQVILCGSPAPREIALGQAIEQACSQPIDNLIGQTSLKQLTAVIAAADVVLAPDSGPAHLATTQGTPVIGLYGHSNPKRTGPYNDLDKVVSVYEQHVEAQHGKPITELPWATRVKGEHIMQDISLEAVISKLGQFVTD